MTKDPVGGVPLNATRRTFDGRVQYKVWAEGSDATIIIEHRNDEELDEATATLLAYVIEPEFAKSMLLEFAQADLHKEPDNE